MTGSLDGQSSRLWSAHVWVSDLLTRKEIALQSACPFIWLRAGIPFKSSRLFRCTTTGSFYIFTSLTFVWFNGPLVQIDVLPGVTVSCLGMAECPRKRERKKMKCIERKNSPNKGVSIWAYYAIHPTLWARKQGQIFCSLSYHRVRPVSDLFWPEHCSGLVIPLMVQGFLSYGGPVVKILFWVSSVLTWCKQKLTQPSGI